MFTKKYAEKEKQHDRVCTQLEEVRLVMDAPEAVSYTQLTLWIHVMIVCRNTLGFPIRKSPVITVHITLPTLIAD